MTILKTIKNWFVKEELAKPVGGSIRSAKSTPDEGTKSRTDLLKDYELIYRQDPIVFNGINQIVKAFFSSGYRLISKRPNVTTYFENFREQVDLDSKILKIVQHLCIYGDSWVEIVYNRNGTKIVGLEIIDPKKMDYKRHPDGQIMLDSNQNPVGYVEKLPMPIVDEKTGLSKDVIEFSADQIAHFTLHDVGDAFFGIGLVEPLYKITLAKMNIEDGLAQSIHRIGYPIIWIKVGDKEHHPSQEKIDHALELTRNISYEHVISLPFYMEPNVLETRKPERFSGFLEYFIRQQIAVLGPKAFVSGLGEQTNKATLAIMSVMFERKIKRMQNIIGKRIEQDIFAKIADLNNLPGYPTISWNPISLDELNSFSQRLAMYQKSGLLTPDEELEKYIRYLEDLPPLKRNQENLETPEKKTKKNKIKEEKIKKEKED